jgi:hypothetical protein
MDKADMVRLQDEFVKNMTKFSSRLAAAWADAMKRAGLPAVSEFQHKAGAGWWDPSLLLQMVGSPSAGEKIQHAMQRAADDLPDLLNAFGERTKIGRITDRWAKSYERSVREVLGLPGHSETQRLLEQWRLVASTLPVSSGSVPAAMAPPFISMMFPGIGSYPGFQDPRIEMVRAWTETYGKTLGQAFVSPGQAFTPDLGERTRNAAEAQIRFLTGLHQFQEQIAAAAKRTMEQLVQSIEHLGPKQVNFELQTLFSEMWFSANQRMVQELFLSESFLQTLAQTLQQGLDARTQMETLMGKWATLWNRPGNKELEDLCEKVRSMEDRIRLMEREIDDLKRRHQGPSPGSGEVKEA